MATKPGILTDWPWTPLGRFKYVILAPWAIHSTYSFIVKDKSERSLSLFLIFPFLLWRMLHNQIWISLSRYWTAKGKNSIVDKSIEFDQVDRESNWEDQILFNGALFYLASKTLTQAENLPLWRTDGVIMTFLLHSGPVEFLYYWLHRALHHHYLYSRYHSHHHSSIATEPITSVIHPFAEHIAYFALFSIPMLTAILTDTASIASIASYLTYIDFMNNMGHCNHELIPKWLFSIFPPLKYLMYTPSWLGDELFDFGWLVVQRKRHQGIETERWRRRERESYMRKAGTTVAQGKTATMAQGKNDRIISGWSTRGVSVGVMAWLYFLQWQNETINNLIEEPILEAEERGAKVLSLGLLNQEEELNRYGALYVERYPKLNVKVVDGSSLAVAVLLNSIPRGTTQVVLRGKLTKVAYALAFNLCQRGIKVLTIREDDFLKLNKSFNTNSESNLIFSVSYYQKIWLVGDGLDEEEQLKAPKGTLFIPISQFPPKKLRKDCYYHSPPAMVTPRSLENMHSCENWFPRRVMNAWRIAGIVHALEGWNEHECGNTMSNIEKVWQASLQHGFQPLLPPTESKC
uniref:Uncharacterized protein n=1 Tax=Quercus lobata TaxID=97700 RepID=A0A7N2LD96_QUELO